MPLERPMEHWNAGKMGKAQMTQCVIDKSAQGKIRLKRFHPFETQPSNIPPFHYSMTGP